MKEMKEIIAKPIPRTLDTEEKTNQLTKPISAIEIMTSEWPVTEMIIPVICPHNMYQS